MRHTKTSSYFSYAATWVKFTTRDVFAIHSHRTQSSVGILQYTACTHELFLQQSAW
eukprot:m.1649001 g.1649001  ORF g.1649001 m.1649001 type:complete len:56 (+) comp81535_c0_seq1:33-200(+)